MHQKDDSLLSYWVVASKMKADAEEKEEEMQDCSCGLFHDGSKKERQQKLGSLTIRYKQSNVHLQQVPEQSYHSWFAYLFTYWCFAYSFTMFNLEYKTCGKTLLRRLCSVVMLHPWPRTERSITICSQVLEADLVSLSCVRDESTCNGDALGFSKWRCY